jgi:nucleoside-diphosphate-sugar epimerase
MLAIVTGVAGFIGARLGKRLLDRGDQVIGIDSFLDSYPQEIKEDRLNDLYPFGDFSFVQGDLTEIDLVNLLREADCVFHLAAQAGVRTSWGKRFEVYVNSNILATQKLLEAAKGSSIRRFIFASSSSVYGDAAEFPTTEGTSPRPISPYGVTKVAGEHLCDLYQQNFDVPTVVLRYFTAYGPKPRPDQAVCLFTRALIDHGEIQVLGDGEQLRGMTYVEDIVQANLKAVERDCVGEIVNIGGGSSITVNELIACLEGLTGEKARTRFVDKVKGDVRDNLADSTRARQILDWVPEVEMEKGLEETVESIKAFYYSD